MKINSIVLNNFGSYEGKTVFDMNSPDNERNIILVGGKNGAGKTTLFTAMRLCLYGYMSMGYKNINSYYNRAVTKLINNNAKMHKPAVAFVKMAMSLSNGHGLDTYVLKREWLLQDTLTESFSVIKNEVALTPDEVADFEKYLLTLIPPELFNLYFFDGEKIADFFLDEGGNSRIKDAFLTLCGYDTFEIMRKNFKRISSGSGKASPQLEEYLEMKTTVAEMREKAQELTMCLKQCQDEIDDCEADIEALEKDYQKKGGVSQEEWNKKLFILKEEEKKRETFNAYLKKCANEIIPFLIIRDQVVALKNQIDEEHAIQKYRNFCEILESDAISEVIKDKMPDIKSVAAKHFGGETKAILDLSIEQSVMVLSQISHILEFETDKITKCKRAIKRSLNLSAKTRKELEESNIATVQEHMKKRSELFERKSTLLSERIELEQQVAKIKEALAEAELSLSKTQSQLESELKKASINDISARSIIMLDKLQQILYRRQIDKLEKFFRKEIRILMRKTKFIDDIHIDDDFVTHIYRNEEFQVDKLLSILETNSEAQFVSVLGLAAIEKLKKLSKCENVKDIALYFSKSKDTTVILPVEIDKLSLSNGEKQIFIMTLYHSLIQLCNHEVPFIIDTPFARIDSEHRRNISKHFFCKLNGQVFILSTNEEINSAHVQIMKDKISATYMLENADDKRTIVVSDKYFEV